MEEDIPCMSYPFYSTLLLGIIKIGECIWHLSSLYPTSNVDRGLDIVLFSSVKREGLIVEKKESGLDSRPTCVDVALYLRSSSSFRRAAPHWLWTLRECVVEWPTSHGLFREKMLYLFLKVVLLLTQRKLLSERYCTIGKITKIQDL